MRIERSRLRHKAVSALITILCLIAFFVTPIRTAAAEAGEGLDLNREGSISINYRDKKTGQPFSFGTKVGVFRVADISMENGFHFVYDELFESVGEPPTLASEMNDELAERLEEIAIFKGISLEVPSEEINELRGNTTFEGLTPGLFLVIQMQRGTDSLRYQISPFIVTVPVQKSDGSFDYDVEMLFTSGEQQPGSAALANEGDTMIDTTSVSNQQEKQNQNKTRLPIVAVGIIAVIVIGFLIITRKEE